MGIIADKLYRTDNMDNLRAAKRECVARGKPQMIPCIKLLFLTAAEVTGQEIINVIESR